MNIPARVSPHRDFAGFALAILTVLFSNRTETDGLAGILAYNPAGTGGRGDSCNFGFAHCLLDCLFELALEVPGRSHSGAAYRPSTNRAGILCFGCTRFAQSARTRLAISYWTHPGVHFRWARDRLYYL